MDWIGLDWIGLDKLFCSLCKIIFRWSEELFTFDEDGNAIEYEQNHEVSENTQSHPHAEYMNGEYMMEPDHYLEDRDAGIIGLQDEEREYAQNYTGYQQSEHAYY